MNKNRRGQIGMMVTLLLGFIIISLLIVLIPALVAMLDVAQQSDGLNCPGFVYNGNANHQLSYNATIGTKSNTACLGLKLYIPYIVLAILLSVVSLIIYNKVSSSYQTVSYG